MSNIHIARNFRSAFAGALALWATTAAPPAVAEPLTCFNDWSTAAPVAQREGLLTLDGLTSKVARQHDGKLLKAILCKTPANYVYRVVIKQDNGRLGTLILNAHP